MKERRVVLDAIAESHRAGEAVVVATVVRTQGSTYRRPGARLVVLREGRRVGTISGGCLEADLGKKAWWLTQNGPTLATYDTLNDDDDTADYRMGCRGVVDILLERVEPGGEPDDLLAIRRSIEHGESCLIATVYQADQSSGLSLGERLQINESSRERLPVAAWEAMQAGSTKSLRVDGLGLFIEPVQPPLRLILFGSGPDAEPVAMLARDMGWSVTAVDRRLSRLARIPADRTIAGPIAETLPRIGLDSTCRVVVMTHDFQDDREALRAALLSEAAYVGVLGPRHRTETLLAQIGDSGRTINDAMRNRLHAPIGLDLGADAPEEIALSIIAEIQANHAGRSGFPLRNRSGTIHDRPDVAAASLGGAPLVVCAPSGS